jgi:hypothetical protein
MLPEQHSEQSVFFDNNSQSVFYDGNSLIDKYKNDGIGGIGINEGSLFDVNIHPPSDGIKIDDSHLLHSPFVQNEYGMQKVDLMQEYQIPEYQAPNYTAEDRRSVMEFDEKAYYQENDIANINKFGANYNNYSEGINFVIDKEIGIAPNRVATIDDKITLTDSYMDERLNRTNFGDGRFNIGISNIYGDKAMFAAHFGIISDGLITEDNMLQTAYDRAKINDIPNSENKEIIDIDMNESGSAERKSGLFALNKNKI